MRETLQRAWLLRGWLARSLWPLSRLYALLVAIRQHSYASGRSPVEEIGVPVLVVGNVVVGGVGKTPVVMALAAHLCAQGWMLGIVSRGYGRNSTNCQEVLASSRASEVGDEPLQAARHFARAGLRVPIFVAPSRAVAARALLARHPQTQLLISDDGLQHYSLQRQLEVCVFDDRGVGNGWLLPAGPLREPWPRRYAPSANNCLVLHTGEHAVSGPGMTGFCAKRSLVSHALRSDGQTVALDELRNSGQALLALAGIAQPEAFFAMLRSQGLVLARTLALPDHFDFKRFERPADQAYRLICTEKDAVKLWPHAPDALAVPLRLQLEPAFLAAIDEWLAQQLPAGPRAPLSSAQT